MFSRRRISPRPPMYLLIVGSHCCVMRFAYALHMRRQNIVLFPCLYSEPFELVIQIIFHYCNTPPCLKINLLKVHSRAFALSASMMLLCCSLASSSFTHRKISFLSDDRLNSRMHSLVITVPSGLRFQDYFHKTLSGRNHSVPFRALSQRLFFQFLLPFTSAILCCISA